MTPIRSYSSGGRTSGRFRGPAFPFSSHAHLCRALVGGLLALVLSEVRIFGAAPLNADSDLAASAEPATAPPAAAAPAVFISEFMADNRSTLKDEDGDTSDWLELFNAGETDVNLSGWFLTDDPLILTKWSFPDVAINPNGFLLVFASAKNKIVPAGRLHTNFKLSASGGYLALVNPETNVVSEFAPRYPAQAADISYGRARGAADEVGFFAQATPGGPNSISGAGFAGEVQFSRASGTFVEPFSLSLSPSAGGGVVRYTQDGNLPTSASPVFSAPIPITNSVQVRARSYQPGLLPGPVQTETFLLLTNNVVEFTSDLPVFVIHALGKGAPTDARQTFAHVEVFEPINGVTSLTNQPTLVTRSGIKVRGSSTDGLVKASFALECWDEYNLDQKRSLLGMPADSDWVLYAPNQFDPVLIHNPFIHQLSRDMGRYSSRTRFVEVYLNKSTGTVTAAHYNGIYVLEEKVKIAPHRVAIDKLEPYHVTAPEVTGGYLLKIDRTDPGDSGFSAGGQPMAYVDPKEREIKLPQRDPQEQFIKTYFNNFAKALNGTNWLDPVQGYAGFIDVESWIDFHVLEVLSGNVDAIVLSTYFHKPRDGKIIFGPHWDFDRALGSTDGRDANPRTWNTGPFFSSWWGRLCRDPDFWQKWIDRYQELRTSLFARTNLHALIDRLADEVRAAQPRDRKRWNRPMRGGSYQSELNLMKNWVSNRTEFIDKQFVQPPVLSAPGGQVTAGFTLELSGPTNATLFYTLDGSDPRLPQGGVSPRALIADGPVPITSDARVVARARNLAQRQTGGPPISSPWSRPVAATFTVHPPPLLLTEIMFHPEPPPVGSLFTAAAFEFVELKNVSGNVLQLPGYRLTGGIEFAFTSSSAVTALAPGARVLLVKNVTAFQSRYPNAGPIAGQFIGNLENDGTRLVLTGPLGEPVFDLHYYGSWERLADGFGFSLVAADEALPPPAGTVEPAAWRLSAQSGGSPGEGDPPPQPVPHVFVNELLPNPASGGKDELELFNSESVPAELSGWFLTDELRQPRKFRFPVGTIVPANGYLTFKAISSLTGFSFSKAGEQVYLFSADAPGNLTGWLHGFDFGPAEAGVSFGRFVTRSGTERFVAQLRPTFDSANSGPRVGPIVLSEILPVPAGSTASSRFLEFIELFNASAASVPLFDPVHPQHTWCLRGAVDFDFPPQTVLAPRAYLVVVGFDPENNPAARAAFRSQYGSDPVLLGPWRGQLNSPDMTVRLTKPGQGTGVAEGDVPRILVEEVTLGSEATPGPSLSTLNNGRPISWVRREVTSFADDPANWTFGLPSPGDTDSDSDGLPDQWEQAHALDSHTAAGLDGPDGDADGDGLSNRQEFISGTDPHNPQSALSLASPARGAAAVELPLTLAPGRSYVIQATENLAKGPWETVQILLGPANGRLVLSQAPSSRQRFYRLVIP